MRGYFVVYRTHRLFFPIFNTLLVMILGGGLSRLLGNMPIWLLASGAFGLVTGITLEFGFGAWHRTRWLYRWRVVLATLIEVPFFLMMIGPWVFVIQRTQPQPGVICCQSPADFGAGYSEIQFEAYDGTKLAGWYLTPEQEPDAVVIVLHGIGGNRMQVLDYAEILYQAGYGVLLYDQRALGASEGQMQSFGWLDVADVPAAVDIILDELVANPVPVGIVGISLGGHIAIPAAAHDPRIAAIWVDGVAAQHYADFPAIQNSAEIIQKMYYGLLDLALWARVGMSPEPIVDMIEGVAPRPVMIVAGGRTQLETRTGERYAQRAGETAQLWVIPEAGHVGGLSLIPDKYAEMLIAFFDRAVRNEG